MKRVLYSAILCVFGYLLNGQTADVSEGCIPLVVQFEGPQLQQWFWDFGDSTSSTDQNPDHTYTSPGEYDVILSEGQGGATIGTLTISVFPEVNVSLSSDVDSGCIPLDVQFNTNITQVSGITIDSLKWTFGDGAEQIGDNLFHTYNLARVFDLSIEVFTTPSNCRNIFRFEDRIEAEDLTAEITPDGEIPCTEPASFSYIIDKPEDPRYTYTWDFGNGTTASGYNAGLATYNAFGSYSVSLVISSPSGCTVTNQAEIQIGPPAIEIQHPDSLCIGQQFVATTSTIANRYEWTFGDTLQKSLQREITSAYYTPGLKPIVLETFLDENCKSDTTIYIFIEIPNSDFTVSPAIFCSDTTDKVLNPIVATHNTYIWNDSVSTQPSFLVPGIEIERDSFYIPVQDTLKVTLEVVSQLGCTSETTNTFISRLPEAYFIPDKLLGIEDLTVTFSDFSQSMSSITRRTWDYGDGNTRTFTDSTVVHSYTYDTCGIYFITLEIEDSDGCIDRTTKTRARVVRCPIEGGGGGTGSETEPDTSINIPSKICVGDTTLIPFVSDSIRETDILFNGERLNYCWNFPLIIHIYDEPGFFDLSNIRYVLDEEVSRSDVLRTIEVEGASAHFDYEISCDSPQLVQLTSQANNATDLEWVLDDQVVSTSEEFELTISEPGAHTIYLRAQNTPSGCPADITSTTVYIQEPVAQFTLPSEVCDSVPVLLDAKASENVFASCHQGYRWEFEHQRPRVTQEPILEHAFAGGDQEVTLIVTDINGCSDTVSNKIKAFGLDPDFLIDSLVCLPYPKDLQNLTTSDTTVIAWDWSFGSTEFSPSYTFDENDILAGTEDTILVSLSAEDAFGCKDTLSKFIRTFEPRFGLDLVGSRILCQGDSRKFFVFDSTGVQELFEFTWDFYGVEQVDSTDFRHTFDVDGNLPVTLTYQQIGGGCRTTLDTTIIVFPAPEVCFTTDIDTLDFICAPAQVTFFPCDSSILENNYEWQLGADDASVLPMPSNDFGAGTHEIQLVVTNDRTCTDTLTQFITLSGSTGEIISDQDVVCLGQEANFDLIDTLNIGSILWDFGDGTTIENQAPVTHTYDSDLQSGVNFIKLILESPDGNCTTIDSIPIELSSVDANFVNLDSLNICDGRIRLQNTSIGANQFEWEFEDGTILTEENPIILGEVGTQTIQLFVSNDESGCSDFISRDITIPDQIDTELLFPNLFSPNGDGNNDVFAPAIPEDLLQEITINVFRIYNRWGELVYDNTNPEGWNGFYENEAAPPEVYAYYIELSLEGCDTIAKKGNVTLIR